MSYDEIVKSSTAHVLGEIAARQQAAAIAAARPAPQPAEIAKAEPEPAPHMSVEKFQQIEAQTLAKLEKERRQIARELRGGIFEPLIRKGIEKCVAFGVPAEWIPNFRTNPGYFAKADSGTDAAYDLVSREIWINTDSIFIRDLSRQPGTDWHSSLDECHNVVHELCHGARHRHLGVGAERPYVMTAEVEKIARRVSEYAAKSVHEFCAETLAGLILGRSFDAEVMATYEKLGGWLPKGFAQVQKAETAPPQIRVNVPPAPAPVVQVTVTPEVTAVIPPHTEKMSVERNSKGQITSTTTEVRP